MLRLFGGRFNRINAFTANIISFIVCAICGIGIPICVGAFYSPEVLGFFNITFSFYIVLSQVAAFGVHLSVVKYTAEFVHDDVRRRTSIFSGFILTVILSCITSFIFYKSRCVVGYIYSSDAIADSVLWVSLGVLFFSINKTLLAILNALERFVEFAFYSAFRYILMLASLAVILLSKLDSEFLPAIFFSSELVLFVLLLFSLVDEFMLSHLFLDFIQKHLKFGSKAIGGHLMLVINSRIDILCLGIFVNDYLIGIYSMASLFAEGGVQLLTVLRTLYTPRVVRLLADKKNDELIRFIHSRRIIIWIAVAVGVLCAYLIYPYIVSLVTADSSFSSGQIYFGIIMLGVWCASGYLPFGFILANAGYPGRHSLMIMILLSVNVVGNLILIPAVGVIGAAISTMSSYILSVFLLKKFARKFIQIKI